MLSSITDVARVRKLGGLSTDESTGAPTTAQVEAAIAIAQTKMLKVVSRTSYVTVQALTKAVMDADTDEARALKEQFETYSTAEAYFALGALGWIARNQQQGQNGVTSSVQIGQGTTSFVSVQDIKDAEAHWEKLAMDTLDLDDDDNFAVIGI